MSIAPYITYKVLYYKYMLSAQERRKLAIFHKAASGFFMRLCPHTLKTFHPFRRRARRFLISRAILFSIFDLQYS